MWLEDHKSGKKEEDTTKGYTVSGQGPLIVLLHSSMSSKDQWNPLIPLLCHQFKMVSIDLAGYGDNELPQNPQTFSTGDEVAVVQDILLKQTHGKEAFHLVGHSYGGAIALKLAVKQTARIKTLTIFEPVAFHLLPAGGTARDEITTIAQRLTRALENNDKKLATALFIDYWSGCGTFENLKQNNQTRFIRYIDKVVLDFQALFAESLTLDDYSTVNIPVCMIKGEKSPLSSLQIFQILERCFPDHCVHSVPGGHMSPITHADKVNQIITAFLTTHAFG